MFALTQASAFTISQPPETYLYDLVSVDRGLAVISSDNALRLLDPRALTSQPLSLISNIHSETTCLKALDVSNSIVTTAGRDGRISIFDLRLSPTAAKVHETKSESNVPVLSLACLASAFTIAAGTELASSQATVLIWDTRNLNTPRVQYVESHSDDVTELQYHPVHSSLLLSGSTDGLVNIYNTDIVEEEDALHQTINLGSSIHRAGFLTATDIFALSHDERFAVYQLVTDPDEVVEDSGTVDFGDLRERLGCEYVANVVSRPDGGAVVGVGNHSQKSFNLIHLGKNETSWALDTESVVTLPGAHGEEVVRSFCFLDQLRLVLTAGEDSQLKAWSSDS